MLDIELDMDIEIDMDPIRSPFSPDIEVQDDSACTRFCGESEKE